MTDVAVIDLAVAKNTALPGATGPFVGVEIERTWKSIEDVTPGSYNFTSLINTLDYAGTKGMVVRVLLTTKYTPSPAYFEDTSMFGGVKGYFTSGTGGGTVKMHRLWLTQVQARWKLMMGAFNTAIVNYSNPGDPAKQARVRGAFYGICHQEPHLGVPNPSAAAQGMPSNYAIAYVEGITEVNKHCRTTAMPSRMCWQMSNISYTKGLTIMLTAAKSHGYGLCAPDTYCLEPHREQSGSMPSALRDDYDSKAANSDIIPVSIHIYTENYGKEWHNAQDDHISRVYSQPIYAVGRSAVSPPGWAADGNDNGGLGLYNFARDKLKVHNLVITPTNSAAGWPGVTTGNPTFNGWDRVQAFFDSVNFSNANGAGGLNPGIPSTIVVGGGGLPAPTIALAVANPIPGGAAITKNTAANKVQITDLASGASAQWSTAAAGPWSASQPTYIVGLNTVYGRQTNTAGAVSSETAFTFTYDNAVPTVSSLQVNADKIDAVYNEVLANASPYVPVLADFSAKVVAVARTLIAILVDGPAKNIEFTLASPVTAGQDVTLTYVVPGGTAGTNDLAGNKAAAMTDATVTNVTGAGGGAPTQTILLSVIDDDLGAIVDNGYTNRKKPLITGVLSAALTAGQTVALQRNTVYIDDMVVAGTDLSFTELLDLVDGVYTYRARVRAGPGLSGEFSPNHTINLDTVAPNLPTVVSLATEDTTPLVSGTWTNVAGHVLTAIIDGITYGVGTGITVIADNWELQVTVPLVYGNYDVVVNVTDEAGNVASIGGEGDTELDILIPLSAASSGNRLKIKLFT